MVVYFLRRDVAKSYDWICSDRIPTKQSCSIKDADDSSQSEWKVTLFWI